MILKKQYSALEQENNNLRDEVRNLKNQLSKDFMGSNSQLASMQGASNAYHDAISQYSQENRGSGWLNQGQSPYSQNHSPYGNQHPSDFKILKNDKSKTQVLNKDEVIEC